MASLWHIASRHRAPWKWVPAPGLVSERGTAVRLRLQNPLSPLLDGAFVETALRAHFQPLLDPAFDGVLAAAYPHGVAFVLNGRSVERESARVERAALAVRVGRRRKPSAVGYLVRNGAPVSDDERGVAVSTLGKVIKRGWDWLGVSPARPDAIAGLIEVPGGSIDPNVVDTAAADSGFAAQVVQGGPNSGLWYVVGANWYIDHTSEMNPFIRPGGRADTLSNSTDQRVCRQALGLGNGDPVVVNFHTYNTICRGFSLDSMFAAFWRHEGFGSRDPLDPSAANGHEARRYIGAREPVNDPYRILEGFVHRSYAELKLLVRWAIWDADRRISTFVDTLHTFVRDNYIVQGNRCGEAWVVETVDRRYYKIRLDQNGPCP